MEIKNISLAVLVLVSSGASLEAQTASEIAEQQKNLNLWRVEINKSKDMPNEKAIPLLGRCIVKMTDQGIYQIDTRLEVYREAQVTLLAIPGHAEYYRDRILEARVHLDANLTSAGEAGPATGRWRDAQVDARKVLMNLPSPETVRVLGELLSETWIYPQGEGLRAGSTAEYSLGALYKLPLVNKPAKTQHDHEVLADLPTWQNWYDQIKAGNRTFRFEEDPTEYDLNGPASKEKLQRIERDRKRDEERWVGHRKSSSDSKVGSAISQIGKPSAIAGILAACALVAGAVWYFLRGRNMA